MRIRLCAAAAAFFLVSAFAASAQEWRFDVDTTSSLISIGVYPLDDASLFVTELFARDAAYMRFGAGPAFSDDFYFLIPELESSFYWYSGVELVRGAAFDSTRVYSRFELEQVLVGDRYHLKSWVAVAIGDQSRLVIPDAPAGGGPAPEMFFLHRPALRLSVDSAEDPFWSVLQFHLNASAAVEMGHSAARGFWAFPVAGTGMGADLPILGEYLYLGLSGSGAAVFPGFTSGVVLPPESYSGYEDPVSFTASAELRSRFLRFEILFPMALELVVFGSAYGTAQSMDLAGLSWTPVVGAYLEHAGELRYVFSYRIKVGATYDIRTGAIGFLFSVQ